MTTRIRALLIGIAVVLAMTACGEEEVAPVAPGALAEYVPAEAEAYAEALLDPSDDLSATFDAALEGFGSDPDVDIPEARDGALEGFAEDLGLEGLSYEDDLEPWLGARGAGFVLTELSEVPVTGGEVDSEAADTAGIVAVDDPEEARETLERLIGPAAEDEGRATFTSEGGSKVVLVEDRVLIGDAAAVDAALEAAASGSSLATEGWFEDGLASVGDGDSLGFLLADGPAFTELSLRAEGPRFAERFAEPLVEGLEAFDVEQPYTIEFTAPGEGLAVDVGYGVAEDVDLAAAERQLGDLPANSWLVLNDPLVPSVLIESFEIGLEIGLQGRGPGARDDLVAELGYDPLAALAELSGTGTLFAAGEFPAITAGALLDVEPGARTAFPVDAARFGGAAFLGNSFAPEPLRFGGPFAFTTPLSDAFMLDLAATEYRGRLGLIVGAAPEDLPEVFEPPETLAEGPELASARKRLGDEWTLLGFADLERAVTAAALLDPTLATLDAGDDEFLAAADVLLGARLEGTRIIQRYQLATE